ncbi:hypothetical protein SEPCBS119000_002696 [Sporothrix epigloea]|uniref:Peptidase M20 dimerisation domain-containing protein n=1 Tax=Sporothrix epigloea TaxID=1892477 RepID=A0ABP0DHI1_9PEZI
MYSSRAVVHAALKVPWSRTQAFKPLHRHSLATPKMGDSIPPISRNFSIAAKDMGKLDYQTIKVNQDRLMKSIHETCEFGTGERAPTETGMSRLALSDADKQVRDWFVQTTQNLGCQTTVDSMGNIFAVRPGRHGLNGPATFAGSHLDTQPTGGRYDGILGVHAGVEMLRVLQELDIQTEFPVGVINWTNEEGARFPKSMTASGVWAGEIPEADAYSLQEVGGGTATIQSELQRIGYLGMVPASYQAMPIAAHFELHIEQGPILETEQKKIGIVTGVQAYRWFTLDVRGRGKSHAHTGTTPFAARADALLLAARMIVHAQLLAATKGALASTGILTALPGSTNTVPGHVRFSLDIRAPLDATVDELETALRKDFDALARGEPTAYSPAPPGNGRPLTVSWQADTLSPATHFHPDCIAAVRDAAHSVLAAPAAASSASPSSLLREITSGAGHDSVYTSRHCPTSMIFVPCRDGVSHNPTEYCSPEDCALGAEVLCQAVLRYDQLRSAAA